MKQARPGTLDRHIALRMLANFAILFTLGCLFTMMIDVVSNLDRFHEVARWMLGADASTASVVARIAVLVVDFEGPRIFQFYAFLHGLVAIGAMGFTLVQMARHRELVAILAAGVSLWRVALPIVAVSAALGLLQVANHEFLLPRIAPQLLRRHSEIGRESVASFPVEFTPDGRGVLLMARSFDPSQDVLESPLFLQRNAEGRTIARTHAADATWDEARGGWRLEEGWTVSLEPRNDDAFAGPPRPIDFHETDLSPHMLTLRRHGSYISMLSLHQISEMLDASGVIDVESLLRSRYSRFASVILDVLVLLIAMPFFLDREPRSALRQSLLCAATIIPVASAATLVMLSPVPGLPTVAGTFLPVVVLIPVAMARISGLRT